jgi:hypothetical protein
MTTWFCSLVIKQSVKFSGPGVTNLFWVRATRKIFQFEMGTIFFYKNNTIIRALIYYVCIFPIFNPIPNIRRNNKIRKLESKNIIKHWLNSLSQNCLCISSRGHLGVREHTVGDPCSRPMFCGWSERIIGGVFSLSKKKWRKEMCSHLSANCCKDPAFWGENNWSAVRNGSSSTTRK